MMSTRRKRLCCILIILIFVFTAVSSYATQSNKQTEKDEYLKELEKEKKDNPKEYEKTKKAFVFTAELLLGSLGYGIEPFDGILDEKTKNALKTYEKKRNIPESGDPLSFDTIEQLQADMETFEYKPISLPLLHIFTDFWDNGFVSASGTWVFSNDKMGEPEQSSKIICDRSTNTCTEATAIIYHSGNYGLFVDIDRYEIERWDEHEIVTKPREFECTRYVIRFNKLQKSVTKIRSTISNEGMCKGIEDNEKYLVLTDGFKVYWELYQESRKKWRQLLNISPALLQSLESDEKQAAK